MTLAEFNRLIESKQRVQKVEAQEKATYDYILADLVGRSLARAFSNSAKYPEIYDAYPSLFDRNAIEDSREQRRMELSAKRFEKFAESFNKKFKGKEDTDE